MSESSSKPCPISMAKNVYRKMIQVASHLQSFILLLIRLAWGWELAEAGYGHLTSIAESTANFRDFGVPFPKLSVYMAGGTEMIGGTLLMIGLASRLISIPLVFNFCVAYWTASHYKVTHIFKQTPDKIIDDTAFPFLITSILILAFGPGKASVDYLLRKFVFHERDSVLLKPGEVVNP